MQNRPGIRGKSAFTVVELLVVISVIAILAALLMPALSGAKEKADAATCSQNLKQIGAGLIMFAGEHEGFFPIAGSTLARGETDAKTGQPGWTEQLDSYLGAETKVYRCPGSARVIPKNRTYGYFLGTRAAYLATGDFAAVNVHKLNAPSKYILGGDISADYFTADDADKDDYSQNPAFAATPAPFHGGRVNILFADGSVRQNRTFDSQAMEISYDGPGAVY